MLRFAVAVVALFVASPAFAQIIYEPVTYQYSTGVQDGHYFYGGNNPRVLAHARAIYNCRPMRFGYATNLHNFDGGNSFGQPNPMYYRAAVYTDCVGGGFTDASWYGWSAIDAHNEANANAATYFRKADLLASASVGEDGALHVSPNAGSVRITPVYVHPTNRPAPAATTETMMPRRGQIIIIPKNLLDRPLKDFMAKPDKVAMAQ